MLFSFKLMSFYLFLPLRLQQFFISVIFVLSSYREDLCYSYSVHSIYCLSKVNKVFHSIRFLKYQQQLFLKVAYQRSIFNSPLYQQQKYGLMRYYSTFNIRFQVLQLIIDVLVDQFTSIVQYLLIYFIIVLNYRMRYSILYVSVLTL